MKKKQVLYNLDQDQLLPVDDYEQKKAAWRTMNETGFGMLRGVLNRVLKQKD